MARTGVSKVVVEAEDEEELTVGAAAAAAAAAAADSDDETNDDDDDDNEDDEEEDDAAAAAATDPKLSKLTADVGKERERRKVVEAENRRLKAASASDADKAAEAQITEVETKWATRFKSTAARAALAEAGVPSEKLTRALKLIDMDALEVDDDGDVDGLDGEVDSLRESFAELFPVKQEPGARRAVAGKVKVGGGQTAEPKKSSADKLAASLLG